jgi:hypothetical protein
VGELVRRRPGRPALPHAAPLCPRASARTRLFQSLMATCDELCETKGSRMGDGLRQGAVMQRRPKFDRLPAPWDSFSRSLFCSGHCYGARLSRAAHIGSGGGQGMPRRTWQVLGGTAPPPPLSLC